MHGALAPQMVRTTYGITLRMDARTLPSPLLPLNFVLYASNKKKGKQGRARCLFQSSRRNDSERAWAVATRPSETDLGDPRRHLQVASCVCVRVRLFGATVLHNWHRSVLARASSDSAFSERTIERPTLVSPITLPIKLQDTLPSGACEVMYKGATPL